MKSHGKLTQTAILCSILFAFFSMTSCIKEAIFEFDNLTTSGTVSNQSESGADINMGPEQGTASISISANKPWTAEVINTRADDWLSLSASSGKGNETLKVKVSENTSYSERSASIVIKCEGKAKTIRITQKHNEAVLVSSSRIQTKAEGETFSIEVKHNIDYTITVDDKSSDWIHKVDTKALSSETISFSVDPNEELAKREGRIYVSSSRGHEAITVYQDGVSPALILSQSEYTVSDKGGSIEVAVSSNVAVTYEISASWIREIVTKSMSTDTYVFEIIQNEDVEARSASIVFKNHDNGLSETVTVNQMQKDAIVIAKAMYEVDYDGGVIEIEIGHNVEFDVNIDQEWLRQVTTKSYNVETLVFEVLPCESSESREATITISSTDGSLTQRIKVYQGDIIQLSNDIFYFKEQGGNFQLGISSNCEYEVVNPDADWLHEVQTKGFTSKTRSFFVESNNSSETRSAEIIVKGKNSAVSKSVKIIQYPRPVISFDKTEIYVSYKGGNFDLRVDHNVPIELEYESPWYRLSGTEKVSDTCTLYHFIAEPNDTPDTRFAWIMAFYDEGLYGSLVVNQGANDDALPRLQYFTDLPHKSITAVNFFTNSNKTTSICYESGDNPIYGETVGTTVNIYTSAEKFNAKDISQYFTGCESIKTLDLSSWDTSESGSMYGLFMGCRALESVDLSSFDTELVISMGYMFWDCLSLKEVDLSSFKTPNLVDVHDMFAGSTGNMSLEHLDLSGFDTSNIYDAGYMLQLCTDLKSLNLRGWEKIPATANIQGIVFLAGALSEDFKLYTSSEFAERLLEGDAAVGEKVIFILSDGESLYQSTDFSADGRVTLLQKATKGRGVNLVFMGDGYSDRNIESGKYRQDIEKSVEYIFMHEPYRSLREMFNIYEVDVVSQSEHFYQGGSTAFGCTTDTPIDFNSDKIRKYTSQALPTINLDAVTTIVLLNLKNDPGTATMYRPAVWDDRNDYASGYSIAVCGLGRNENSGMAVLMHELGHAFSKLDEEYVKEYVAISPEQIESIREDAKHGWWDNIDFTSDLTRIKWSTFASDSRYAWEEIGAYEGAGTYGFGVWKPTVNSFMNFNTPPYNAPSRAAIYRRIHKLAYGEAWEFDIESFKEWDLGRSKGSVMKTATATSAPREGTTIQSRQKSIPDYHVVNSR